MVVRNIIFTAIFAILLCQTVIAQEPENNTTAVPPTNTSEATTTPSRAKCHYPDEFPLFGDDTCISREVYVAIFLISIILAGISFLSLAILLSCLCCRHWRSADSNYDNDSLESSKPNSRHNSVGPRQFPRGPSDGRTGEQNGASATKTGNSQSPVYYGSTDNYTAPTSLAPYAVGEPVETETPRYKPKNNQALSESIPLETRQPFTKPSKPARLQPLPSQRKVTDLDDDVDDDHRRGRSQTRIDSNIDVPQSTSF